MARLEAQLYDALTIGSPRTLAESRVYPVLAPEGAALPRITYQRVTTRPENGLGGHAGIDLVIVQIDCWAATAVTASAMALEVRRILNSADFKPLVNNEYYGFEPETRIYRVTLDVSCWDKSF